MKITYNALTDELLSDTKYNGTPRIWTVTAWAVLPDGTKETLTLFPKKKKHRLYLSEIISRLGEKLTEFTDEHDVDISEIKDAGFIATAR